MLEHYHGMPVDEATVDRRLIHGPAEQCIRRLREFEQAGIRTLELVPAAKDPRQQLQRIAREIFPAFAD